jgi:tripartite-type tricarboxylate transporter receptor subunit TctC
LGVPVNQATFSRRDFCGGFAGMAAVACGAAVVPKRALGAADACAALSGETIRWIVPNSVGGGFDAYSRLFEPFLEKALDAEVVVVNIPGADGLIGSKVLMTAPPDGRTLGILNGPGLLVGRLFDESKFPSLTSDFTLLGRLVRDVEVWVTAAGSRIAKADDLFGRTAQVVFGVQGVSGTLVSCAVGSELMGIDVAGFLSAYAGSPEILLALLRGELDVTSISWSSAQAAFKAGDIRPLLQVRNVPVDDPALAAVPVLGGADGLAVSRARALGRDVEQVQAQATTLAEIVSAGRFIAAPVGVSPELAACLERNVHEAMTDPGFAAAAKAAGRPLQIARATEAVSALRTADRTSRDFVPILEQSIAKLRG